MILNVYNWDVERLPENIFGTEGSRLFTPQAPLLHCSELGFVVLWRWGGAYLSPPQSQRSGTASSSHPHWSSHGCLASTRCKSVCKRGGTSHPPRGGLMPQPSWYFFAFMHLQGFLMLFLMQLSRAAWLIGVPCLGSFLRFRGEDNA